MVGSTAPAPFIECAFGGLNGRVCLGKFFLVNLCQFVQLFGVDQINSGTSSDLIFHPVDPEPFTYEYKTPPLIFKESPAFLKSSIIDFF